ncbi:hypothetical protein AWB95_01085 [Mycobacterium celatum]|uniref:Uncharacterized protein n=1 Tax=Mycobacterium celatum TaxID=28045 RepID=A0A1X1RX39_MYCCE|nr:hypothetical protein AWB95_01085 [Mycobacterium celatum]PIB79079.1 hypothetical protein CQY23_10345 [Mycobacterium celatum]
MRRGDDGGHSRGDVIGVAAGNRDDPGIVREVKGQHTVSMFSGVVNDADRYTSPMANAAFGFPS